MNRSLQVIIIDNSSSKPTPLIYLNSCIITEVNPIMMQEEIVCIITQHNPKRVYNKRVMHDSGVIAQSRQSDPNLFIHKYFITLDGSMRKEVINPRYPIEDCDIIDHMSIIPTTLISRFRAYMTPPGGNTIPVF